MKYVLSQSNKLAPRASRAFANPLRPAAWQAAPVLGRMAHYGLEKLEDRTLLSVSTDSQGWTVVTPSTDTRTIYVSTSGSDTNDGLSPATPVQSIAQARTKVRNGFPDWIVLRRGDVFNNQRFSTWRTAGRSADEPFVIGAYTDPNEPSTARPVLNTGIETGLTLSAGASHVYIMGLEFEANRRDYRDAPADFTTNFNTDQQGGSYGVFTATNVSDIHLEDNSFRYYRTGIVFQNGPTDIRIQRNVIADSWAVNVDEFGNAMGPDTAANGLYVETVTNLKIDGNVFTHNGWADSNALGARKNVYSHNLYINSGNNNVSVSNNIIAESASHGIQMRAGGNVTGNLFVRNPTAMSYGLVNGLVRPGGVYGEITDNVVVGSTGSYDTARGWGIEIGNLKPASQGGGTVIRNNVFANDTQANSPAIKLDRMNNTNADVGINDLLIEQNIVYAWFKGISIHSEYGSASRPLSGLVVRYNDFQRNTSTGSFAEINNQYSASQQSWYGNRYDSANTAPDAIWFKIGGVNKTFAQWVSQIEPTAIRQLALFPDPGRSAAGYNASIGGVNSADAFLAQAMRQSRSFWRPQYTPGPVNDYIRAGYAGARLDNAAPTGSAEVDNITIAGASTHTFSVTWSDDNQVNIGSLGDGDVRVSGPGYSAVASLVSSTGPADGRKRVATYRIAAPNGKWSAANNGLYTIVAEAGQVDDASGKAAAADTVGSFSIAIDPAVPAAVATTASVTTNSAPVRVDVTYTGEESPPIATSVSPSNAGFETPNVGTGGDAYLYNPVDAGWSFNGRSGIAGNDSGFSASNPSAPQGSQVAFLQWDGSISQAMDGWQAATYTLQFKAAQRGNDGDTNQDFQVLIDGQVIATIQPDGSNYQSFATPAFTVSAGTHTVEFRGLNTVGGDNTALIDDIQIIGTIAATEQVMSAASFDTADIRVTGPNGFLTLPSSISVPENTDGKQRTVSYFVNAPTGGWNSIGASSLAVIVAAGQVSTVSGAFVPAGKIGAIAIGVNAPLVKSVVAADVSASSTGVQTFTVTYTDNNPGDALPASLDNNDLRVIATGYSQLAQLVSQTGAGTAASPLVATYTVSAPAGGWSSTRNGTYWITAQAGQVVDADGNSLPAGAIDSFNVAVDVAAPLAWGKEDPITSLTGVKVINISYYDISGVNTSTIDGSDLRVIRSDGAYNFAAHKRLAVADATASYGEYGLDAPGGKWQSYHNGTYNVVLQPNQVFDSLGNASSTVKTLLSFNVAIETTPPTVGIVAVTPNPRNTAVSTLTLQFSEFVSGVDLADLSLSLNGSPVSLAGASLSTTNGITYTLSNLSGLTASSGTYSFSINASGAGILDDAGNPLATGAVTSWVVDLAKPTATATAPNVTAPGTSPMSVTVSYADNLSLNAATLDINDIRVTGPGTTAVTGVSITGSGATRTATYTLTPPTGGWNSSHNGTYSIVLQSNQVFDSAGNAASSGTIGSFTVALETNAPTVSISPIQPNPRYTPLESVAFNFSETVSGFDRADLSLTRNGQVVSLDGATLSATSGTSYNLSGLTSITSTPGSYTLQLNAPAGIADASGNALANGASATFTVEAVPTFPALFNGGFEAPALPAGEYSSGLADSGWASPPPSAINGAWSSAILAANGSGYTVDNPNAPEGQQVLALQGYAPATQTVRGWTTGQSYVVSLLAAQRGNSQASAQTLQLKIDDQIIGSFRPDDANYQSFTTTSFTTPPGDHVITLVGLNPDGGDNTVLIDDIEIQLASGVAKPAISGISSGPIVGSVFRQNVTLQGSDFSADSTVSLQNQTTGQPATDVQVVSRSETQIVFSARYGEAGGNFAATVSGTTGVSDPLAFSVAPQPTAQASATLNSANTSAGLSLSGVVGNNISYAWSVLSGPGGATITGAAPASPAATVNFTQAGAYTIQVIASDGTASLTRTASVTAAQQLASLSLTPAAATVNTLAQQQFSASAFDQFGKAMTTGLTWSISAGAGTVSSAGLYTAPSTAGSATVRVTSGAIFAQATVTIQTAATTTSFAKIDFVPAGSSVASGYQRDGGATYASRGNGLTYGWSKSHTSSVFDRNVNSNQLIDTTLAIQAGSKWEMAVPNGKYTVNVGVGDAASSTTNNVWIEGVQLYNYVVLSANTFTSRSITVNVADGRLSLAIGSAANLVTRLTHLEVTTATAVPPPTSPPPTSPPTTPPTATGIKVNFQPSGATGVSGYSIDAGLVYGSRGALTYGWSTSHTTSVFDRNKNSNQLLDTTVAIRKGAKWEIGVANGTYSVTISAGDAAAASTNNVWIEGTQFLNYVQRSANTYASKTGTVTVRDGRLSLEIGGAVDLSTRVNYITITPV